MKYLVFGVGMLVLAVGVSLSLWMLLALPPSREGQEGAVPTRGELSQALQQALGLAPEQADALAGQLQQAVEKARATPTAPGVSAPGGMQERSTVGDTVEFEIRDASGKLKQRGAGR